MFSVVSQMRSSGTSTYYEPGFRKVLEDHLEWLINRSVGRVLEIPLSDLVKYKYDLTGYLTSAAINPEMHWIVMRMNNMVSNRDFDGTVTSVIIPDRGDLEELRRRYMTTYKT